MAGQVIVGVSINNLAGEYTLEDLLDFAREAEDLGFDAVWLHDAPLGRRTLAAWDTTAVLAALARVTSRVRLCTGIYQPHLRNLVLIGAPARVGGEVMGSLAVIGPTRMDYEHTITAVSYIARLFDGILNESE